MVTLSPRGK